MSRERFLLCRYINMASTRSSVLAVIVKVVRTHRWRYEPHYH